MLHHTLTRLYTLHDVILPCLRPWPWPRHLPSSVSRRNSPKPQPTRAAVSYYSSSTTDATHSSLGTFLAHAKRSHLDRTSTTFAGTYYEYATQALLRRYGFELDRVGGRGDRGVDLRGIWKIATATGTTSAEQKNHLELPVIIQCKRLKSKVGPNLIRELEGALAARGNTLGVLVGTLGATKGVREAMGRSRVGICWVMLELCGEDAEEGGKRGDSEGKEENGKDDGEIQRRENENKPGIDGILQSMKDELISKAPDAVQEILDPSPPNSQAENPPTPLGRVRQMLWNRAASNMGLEGLDVVMKYDGTRDEHGEVGKEVMLMCLGESVKGLVERE